MNQYVIKAEDLEKRFGKFLVFSSISFKLKKGEILGFLGPSGCGKTTLLNIIAQLIEPDRGKVKVNGDVGYLFQNHPLIPWKNTLENIAFLPKLKSKIGQDGKQRIFKLLKMMKLEQFSKYPIQKISGGMRQRVSFASVLAPIFSKRDSILLLDEPLNGVDTITRERIYWEFRNILKKEGISAILVTHIPEDAIFMCDNLLIFKPSPSKIVEKIRIGFGNKRSLKVRISPSFNILANKLRKKMYNIMGVKKVENST